MMKRHIRASAVVLALVFFAASCSNSLTGGQERTASAAAANRAVSGAYNYGEALQKSIMFYELQRSGKLDQTTIRNNWRGDSGLTDGSDVSLDLTGGWYDAGDHVKFNLPMAYTAAMLAWSVTESKAAYVASGQYSAILDNIKWATDYLIRCHPSKDVYYYQVGDGGLDHSWWGPAEVMQMARPSYKVTTAAPGSTVVAETAAALASAAIVFKDSNPAYAATCLSHAKDLYAFAESTKSDSGYTAAAGFYNSWSGFYDELSWAGVWLYKATGDATYLAKAEQYVSNWGTEPQSTTLAYKWAHCWDDVHVGAQLLIARETQNASMRTLLKDSMERHLSFWTDPAQIKYTPKGLAWLSQWGSLRYSTTTAFLALVYAQWTGADQAKVAGYKTFAQKQIDYALGSTGRSFLIGFGTNPPQHPHHRTAHSSWSDSQSVPVNHRHTLVGALVGGPDASDGYTDSITDYVSNEVACDYNAGFTGALAYMYDTYGGTPIANYKAIETVQGPEMFVTAAVNASGSNFLEVKGLINNQSGWPARNGTKLSFRYFIDLSEALAAGYKVSDLTLKSNYNQGATVTGPFAWDASKNIYYVLVNFTGTNVYPGGQSAYKKEVQFRMSMPDQSNAWNNANDPSYAGIATSANSPVLMQNIPVYDNGVLVFGTEPNSIPDTTAPAKPTALVVSARSLNGLTLDWADNTDTDLAGYRVYRGASATFTPSLSNRIAEPVASAFANTGLTSATTYYYAVSAVDRSGNESDVIRVTGTTLAPDTTAPAVPSGLAAAALSGSQIRLSWAANTEADLAGYKVYRGTSATSLALVTTVTASPFTNTGLTAATAYFYAVSAIDASGNESARSTVVSATTTAPDTTPPAVPAALVATSLSSSQIKLVWTANTEADLAGYKVYRGTSASSLALVTNVTASTLSDSGLAASTAYYYAVSAIDASGNESARSAVASATTAAAPTVSLRVQFFNGETATSGSTISTRMKLINDSGTAVPLSKVTIKYWFTRDTSDALAFACDYAGGPVSGSGWDSVTPSVSGSFAAVSPAKATADTSLIVAFAASAPSIGNNGSIEIQGRTHRTNWSNFNQANDYSFSATGSSYVDYQKVAVYVDGVKVWGTEP